MRKIVEISLNEAAHGDYFTLAGLLDYLIMDRRCNIDKLLGIAERQFNIPIDLSITTLDQIFSNKHFHYC